MFARLFVSFDILTFRRIKCFRLYFDLSSGIFSGEIASCIENAFKRISVADAVQMLFFTNQDEVFPFTQQVV